MKSETNSSFKFFVEPAPSLQKVLEDFLEKLSDSLRQLGASKDEVFLILAGGYGRGEGGVFFSTPESEPQLYNDLEFYLFTKESRLPQNLNQWMHDWAEKGEAYTGIEVEFKWMPISRLVREGTTMFTYDLLSAHVLVFGESNWTEALPQELFDSTQIPLREAVRLLFNRGSTHFFARFALQNDTDRSNSGYVERLQGKIKLALGDSVLSAHQRYHFSCRERNSRLRDLDCHDVPKDFDQIREWHQIGVEFKLKPSYPKWDRDQTLRHHEDLRQVWERTFLWLESRRLEQHFGSLHEYSNTRRNLSPDTPLLKSLVLRLRDRLVRKAHLANMAEYPRAALQRVLAVLQQKQLEERDWSQAARILALETTNPSEIHDAYRMWWLRYN
ncbi:MAG: hypothetical protein AAF558_03565 [Verrucomicrobiota bacterium]